MSDKLIEFTSADKFQDFLRGSSMNPERSPLETLLEYQDRTGSLGVAGVPRSGKAESVQSKIGASKNALNQRLYQMAQKYSKMWPELRGVLPWSSKEEYIADMIKKQLETESKEMKMAGASWLKKFLASFKEKATGR